MSMSYDRRSIHVWGAIAINGVMPLIKTPEKCSARDDLSFLETAAFPNLHNNGDTHGETGKRAGILMACAQCRPQSYRERLGQHEAPAAVYGIRS